MFAKKVTTAPAYQDELRDAICDNKIDTIEQVVKTHPECLKVRIHERET